VRRVALTGSIATGKSHVLECFRRFGIPCVDADELAHGVTGPGTDATRAIADRFGPSVMAPDGAVDRRALGAIVFGDEAARRALEAIVHPVVYREIGAALRAFERIGGQPFAVVAIPLLFETGRAADFDAVVATVCPEAMQIERLAGRGLSAAEARQRIRAQMAGAEKASLADFVIDTSGSFQETDRQVEETVDQLRNPGNGATGTEQPTN
jgi:dephospho-CoA kinase